MVVHQDDGSNAAAADVPPSRKFTRYPREGAPIDDLTGHQAIGAHSKKPLQINDLQGLMLGGEGGTLSLDTISPASPLSIGVLSHFWVEILGRTASKHKVKNHLELRGSKWYLRWDVPVDVRPAFGNKVVIKKALSSDHKEASRMKTQLLAELQGTAHAYRHRKATAQAVDKAEQSNALDSLAAMNKYVKELDDETFANIAKDSISLQDQCSTTDGINELLGDWHEYIEITLSEAPPEVKPFISQKGMEVLFVTHEAANKKFETYELRRKYADAVNAFNLEVKIYVNWNQIHSDLSYEEFRNSAINREITTPKTAKHGASQSLLNKWHSNVDATYKNEKTRTTIKRSLKNFLSHLEQIDSEITFKSVSEYLDQYSNSISTKATQLGAIANFYNWACKYDASFQTRNREIHNPVLGHNLRQSGGVDRESYIGYTREEVKRLFISSIDFSKNGRILAALITYGAYTGCRIEELAQIDGESTIWRDEDPIGFKISKSKTKTGIREVPIHPHLFNLHKSLLRASAGGPIFPHRERVGGAKIAYLSQAFGRLKTHLGFSERHTFHSLRATFITAMTHLETPLIKIERIVGHKPVGTTMGVYLDDIQLEALHEAVAKLDFELNLESVAQVLPH